MRTKKKAKQKYVQQNGQRNWMNRTRVGRRGRANKWTDYGERKKKRNKNEAIRRPIRLKGIIIFFFSRVRTGTSCGERGNTRCHLFSSVLFRKHLYALGVCVCVVVDSISILPYFIPSRFFFLLRLPASRRHQSWMMFHFVGERHDLRLNVYFLCGLRTISAIVSGNEKREWFDSGSASPLANIGSQTKVSGCTIDYAYFSLPDALFPSSFASFRLSSFGNRRRQWGRLLFFGTEREKKKKIVRFDSVLLCMRIVVDVQYWYSDRVFVCPIAFYALIVCQHVLLRKRNFDVDCFGAYCSPASVRSVVCTSIRFCCPCKLQSVLVSILDNFICINMGKLVAVTSEHWTMDGDHWPFDWIDFPIPFGSNSLDCTTTKATSIPSSPSSIFTINDRMSSPIHTAFSPFSRISAPISGMSIGN